MNEQGKEKCNKIEQKIFNDGIRDGMRPRLSCGKNGFPAERSGFQAEQPGCSGGKFSPEQALLAIAGLTVYRGLLEDEIIKKLYELLDCLEPGKFSLKRAVELYCSLIGALLASGNDLKSYLIDKILHTENPFAREAELRGAACLDGALGTAVGCDLGRLELIASLRPDAIKKWMISGCCAADWEAETVSSLPEWGSREAGNRDGDIRETMSADASVSDEYQRHSDRRDCPNSVNRAEKPREPGCQNGGLPCGNCPEMENRDKDYGEEDFRDADSRDPGRGIIAWRFINGRNWPKLARDLAIFHNRHGSGIFSKYKAFVWERTGHDGRFKPVESPDPVMFSDFVSYELEREEIIENTKRFLAGYPANNILIYGDRGTGKSSTVKALVNEYCNLGLRMIEVPKRLLADFPEIAGRLAGRSLKFILFVDDMAFEENEENYTALKAALEGGLECKPPNVLIYATSNRKHLIREKFSDRAGLISGNNDDEIRAADTMQEKLSLSDRFGMTVVFSSPDKKRYLEIVEGIARKRGLDVDRDYMQREALKWELRFNGRSPRTARQFVDWLEGEIRSRKQSGR